MDVSGIEEDPRYTVALAHIKNRIMSMYEGNAPRTFSIRSIQKLIKVPWTSEGWGYTRKITETVLSGFVGEGFIASFTIEPIHEGGPERVYVELPKRPRKKRAKRIKEVKWASWD